MKRVTMIVLLLALILCGYLIRRQAKSAVPPASTTQGTEVINSWQRGITLDLNANYTDPAQRELVETLQAEEKRQRPEEGRN